jgi:hypothetical protein
MSNDNNNEDESILTTKQIEDSVYDPLSGLKRERCYKCKKCIRKYNSEKANEYKINSSYICFTIQSILYLIFIILTRNSIIADDDLKNVIKQLICLLTFSAIFCSCFFIAESENYEYSSYCSLFIIFICIFIFKGVLYILGDVLIKYYFKNKDSPFIVIASLSFLIIYYITIILYNEANEATNLCMILLFGIAYGIIAILIECSIQGFEDIKYLSAIIALQLFFINIGYCLFIQKEYIPKEFLKKVVTLDLYKFKIIFLPLSKILIILYFIDKFLEYFLTCGHCCEQ